MNEFQFYLLDTHRILLIINSNLLTKQVGAVFENFTVTLAQLFCRLRSKRSKSKKYGVIATSGSDNLEMTPLDQDDDDEDLTVFDVNGRR